jgi:phospholipid/cholesterol/gamma-HCH transport system ATP-binding protein
MIAQYREQFDFTALVVTHDVPEALAASDRVALLEDGQIHFEGTPAEFVASCDCVVRSWQQYSRGLDQSQGSAPGSATADQ